MFLRKNRSKKTGRTHMSIVQGYRDADGKNRHKTVRKVGYLDELEKIYDDPIAHFTAVAEDLDGKRADEKSVAVVIDMDERIEKGSGLRKNYGHVVFSKVYHELEIDVFMKNARRHRTFKYNNDAIMRLLVFARLLYPCSKLATLALKDRFFDKFDFSIDDVYNCLDHFDEISGSVQKHLHEQVTKRYQRETDIVYYDVTNYYFDTDRQDDLRKKGAEKNNRKDPIVQMGLLIDKKGLPVSYRLFPGNTHDSQTLLPVLTDIKKRFDTKRIIVVADKALNSGDNIAYHTILGDGYVYSKSIRGASEDFKEWVLDQKGYRKNADGLTLKSMLVPDAVINVTTERVGKRKRRKKETVEQKWICYYSEKYAKRARRKRNETIKKAPLMRSRPHMQP